MFIRDTERKRFTLRFTVGFTLFTVNKFFKLFIMYMIIISNFVEGVVGGIHLKGYTLAFPPILF